MTKRKRVTARQKAAIKDFKATFGNKVGTIEGETSKIPIVLLTSELSTCASDDYRKAFACGPDETAILIRFTTEEANRYANTRINGRHPPRSDPSEWVVFPKQFRGIAVYYAFGKPVTVSS